MAKKGQKFKKYSPKLKEEVIRLYFEEQLPKRTIASLLGIDQSRVRLWINNYSSLDMDFHIQLLNIQILI
ncbi:MULTISPECIES: transposase [unclassified Thermosipho (in: thermotogales)]|uniref:transposase n=1 Tax=unclassified Thermosipho (in: thermotogales) TaxID=2676525 RepID=UPI0009879B02|nr:MULTISPECIES: transposase [unclassified Thermosipho (in: thermotogales)]MBT1247015.1 hypothetical protein [Thermosipho sp. 1244]OOC47038.1 hypothetical protein XO09_03420 [Thermosipho sp. 1223]